MQIGIILVSLVIAAKIDWNKMIDLNEKDIDFNGKEVNNG